METLIKLRYFPALLRFDKDKMQTEKVAGILKSCVKDEIMEERALLRQLWVLINPKQDSQIENATAFDFLLLLMFNAPHQSDRDFE
jgi:hypothetical protein